MPLRHGRTEWAVLAFLLGFAILLIAVSDFYLLPASAAFVKATPGERKLLIAHARLLLMVVLLILFAGLMLTFRVGRFFFPRARGPRTTTQYIDVWAEAGKRADPDDLPDDD